MSVSVLKAHLYLHAVLPALEELLRSSPEARALLQGQDWSVRFGIPGKTGRSLYFKNEAAASSVASASDTSLELIFFSCAHVVALFENKFWGVPLPLWGFWHLGKMKTFQKLAGLLQKSLSPPSADADAAALRLHVRLTLGLALHALPVLARFETETRRELAKGPEGLVTFRLDGDDFSGWAHWKAGAPSAGIGPAPRQADVEISFRNIEIAAAALSNRIDSLAAVGSGDIRVEGFVPLADAVNRALERIPLYLSPRS
jgi:hypothetical protein